MRRLFNGVEWLDLLEYDKFYDALKCLTNDKQEIYVFTDEVKAFEDGDGNLFGPNILNDNVMFL